MKITHLLASLALLGVSSQARAGNARDFGFYFGGSLSKDMATVTQPGVNASLGGWGNALELGLDLPFNDVCGFNLGAELGQKELRNTTTSSTYLDDTKLNSRAVRGSFFYKSLYLGGSYQTAGADLVTISTTSGSSSAHVDLTGSSFFAGYSIMYKNLLRMSVEGESAHYASPGFNYTDYTVGLKLQLLFSGFFDHSNSN